MGTAGELSTAGIWAWAWAWAGQFRWADNRRQADRHLELGRKTGNWELETGKTGIVTYNFFFRLSSILSPTRFLGGFSSTAMHPVPGICIYFRMSDWR